MRSGGELDTRPSGIVVRPGGWPARARRESCPPWLQEVLLAAERRLPMALATAHYTGGVLRIYYVAIDFAAEVRRFRP